MISIKSSCAYRQHLTVHLFCENYGTLMILRLNNFWLSYSPWIKKGVICGILQMYSVQHHQLGNSALKKHKTIYTMFTIKLSNDPLVRLSVGDMCDQWSLLVTHRSTTWSWWAIVMALCLASFVVNNFFKQHILNHIANCKQTLQKWSLIGTMSILLKIKLNWKF